MAEISLAGIRKSFGREEVIGGIDLSIADGEFCVFLGPSGCGKSTLLRLIAGLEDVSGGRIRIDGRDVTKLPPKERGLSMVFQSYALYPHMTVFQNLAFGLHLARRDRSEVERRSQECFCSTSPCPTWTRTFGCACAWSFRGCTNALERPWSMSLMTRWRP